jgi:hypothetical protein
MIESGQPYVRTVVSLLLWWLHPPLVGLQCPLGGLAFPDGTVVTLHAVSPTVTAACIHLPPALVRRISGPRPPLLKSPLEAPLTAAGRPVIAGSADIATVFRRDECWGQRQRLTVHFQAIPKSPEPIRHAGESAEKTPKGCSPQRSRLNYSLFARERLGVKR